jgi:hypothetical protein
MSTVFIKTTGIGDAFVKWSILIALVNILTRLIFLGVSGIARAVEESVVIFAVSVRIGAHTLDGTFVIVSARLSVSGISGVARAFVSANSVFALGIRITVVNTLGIGTGWALVNIGTTITDGFVTFTAHTIISVSNLVHTSSLSGNGTAGEGSVSFALICVHAFRSVFAWLVSKVARTTVRTNVIVTSIFSRATDSRRGSVVLLTLVNILTNACFGAHLITIGAITRVSLLSVAKHEIDALLLFAAESVVLCALVNIRTMASGILRQTGFARARVSFTLWLIDALHPLVAFGAFVKQIGVIALVSIDAGSGSIIFLPSSVTRTSKRSIIINTVRIEVITCGFRLFAFVDVFTLKSISVPTVITFTIPRTNGIETFGIRITLICNCLCRTFEIVYTFVSLQDEAYRVALTLVTSVGIFAHKVFFGTCVGQALVFALVPVHALARIGKVALLLITPVAKALERAFRVPALGIFTAGSFGWVTVSIDALVHVNAKVCGVLLPPIQAFALVITVNISTL